MIKDQNGFSSSGNWYKGNLHSHTVNSDGKLTPEESVRLFREHGYSFLCFSEHDLYTDYRSEFDCEDFIILPGLEASVTLCEEEAPHKKLKVHHIHGILGTEQMQKAAGEHVFREKGSCKTRKIIRNLGRSRGSAESVRLSQEPRLSYHLQPSGMVRAEAEEFIDTEGLWALKSSITIVNEAIRI